MAGSFVSDKAFFHFFRFADNLLGVFDGELTVFIQSNFIFRMVKERYGKVHFETAHGTAQGRLRQMEMFGSGRKSAVFGKGQELLELIEFKHIYHLSCSVAHFCCFTKRFVCVFIIVLCGNGTVLYAGILV